MKEREKKNSKGGKGATVKILQMSKHWERKKRKKVMKVSVRSEWRPDAAGLAWMGLAGALLPKLVCNFESSYEGPTESPARVDRLVDLGLGLPSRLSTHCTTPLYYVTYLWAGGCGAPVNGDFNLFPTGPLPAVWFTQRECGLWVGGRVPLIE